MTGRIALFSGACVIVVAALIAPAPTQAPDRITLKPEVEAFISRMEASHALDGTELRAMFAKLQPHEGILKAFDAPATAKPWHEFRPIFVTPTRTEGGVKFWAENAEILARAKQVYGVPQEIIVAIIGIETIYGRRMGSFRVIDSLYTLGFEAPRRNEFFRSELEQFFLLSRENRFNLLEVKGSFAGAMGMPQFISSSYRRYAVDFDGDGRTDLWESKADVIGSVANYLSTFGWVADAPITVPARLAGPYALEVLDLGFKPNLSLTELKEKGVESTEPLPPDTQAGLFSLDIEQGQEQWLSFNNFYVLTRYNRSKNYAMAVYQLSVAIAQARAAGQRVASAAASK